MVYTVHNIGSANGKKTTATLWGFLSFLCFTRRYIRLRTYEDCLVFTDRLAENHFLSQLEPGVVSNVMAVNTYLCKDQRILDLLGSLHKYSIHTFEHLFNTQITACFLCINGGLDQETTDYILASALLHDIGKLLVPFSILSMPGPLTASEWRMMKNHPFFSVQLLKSLDLPITILTMVNYHHISYNGTGYPKFYNYPFEWDSLEHQKMLTSIGFLAMADAFDAMYHQRPYRLPYHVTQIHEEITSCVSEQFAPRPASFILNALSTLSIRKEVVLC